MPSAISSEIADGLKEWDKNEPERLPRLLEKLEKASLNSNQTFSVS